MTGGGAEIERLIELMAKLPGLGPRSARRAALALVKKRERLLAPLARSTSFSSQKSEVVNLKIGASCSLTA